MSLWGAKSNSAIKPTPPKFRVERIPAAKKLPPIPTKVASRAQPQQPLGPARASSNSKRSPVSSLSDRHDSTRLQPRKRKAIRQKSPLHQRVESDSDDDGSAASFDDLSQKRRKVDGPVDLKRRLRLNRAFSDPDGCVFEMIHAADIISTVGKPRLPSDTAAEDIIVELKYPSASQRERYRLVFGKEKIDPVQEIFEIAGIVADVYLTTEEAKPFTEPNTGIIRKLDRAKNMLSRDYLNKDLLDGFKDAVTVYNKAIAQLINDGVLSKNLDARHHLPFDMVRCILKQVYDRAVSPKVDLLKQYENGTDNVYGELLPRFVSKILGETHLQSDQIFVDLGSGVGNVVLQAALEFGSESWGCEMMGNACKLAEAQKKEFAARCRLWGLKTGTVRLERGDFLENDTIKETMRKADVILVNNQAFTPQLNRRLIDLFLDLKDGCKIISLRSFVPHDHKITPRNRDDPVNVLDVVTGEYFDKCVSWTDVGGNYFIATKDSKRLEEFGG